MKTTTIWHPAPRGLVTAAATERWTRQHPAPDLVVYLWVWSQHDDGERPTRRQIARLFGWTEHHARTLLKRVKADHSAWHQAHPPRTRHSYRPPKPSNGADLRDQVAQVSPTFHHESPDHAGAFTTQHTHSTTGTRPEPVKDQTNGK
jgi:hypothetical protein